MLVIILITKESCVDPRCVAVSAADSSISSDYEVWYLIFALELLDLTRQVMNSDGDG